MRQEDAPATEEMIRLYREEGLSMQQIGDRYGIIRQSVQARLARAGVARLPPKHARISKERLAALYADDRLSLGKIAAALETSLHVVRLALEFHRIPKRAPVKLGGRHADLLRSFAVGESRELRLKMKAPQAQLHRAAAVVGIKVSVVKSGGGKFRVTRLA